MKAIAPGKLILSGEHAVVYGCPAVAMAIDRSAQAVIAPGVPDRVSFDLHNYDYNESFTLRTLHDLKGRVSDNYHLFLNGKLGIRDVLHKPVELFQYAFITILDAMHLTLEQGLHVQLFSTIPIGCGLGSSAATVLSELRAVGHFFRVDFKPEWHYRYSLEAEKVQHGRASGVDSYISLHGGCARFENGEAKSLPLPRGPLFLVQTGMPQTSTGECVSAVEDRYGASDIWGEFAACTAAFEVSLVQGDFEGIQRAIRRNHQLLVRIGVVPNRVQQFISAVEQAGAAAKICGAGAVLGENAGMVLVVSENPPVELCRKFGYDLVAVRGEPLGSRIVS
ncbi:MAG: mevalonate kinase [Verrucomicrobia bacterium]|nr:mevalonate kinase [Verrucomicrobiota bacterium]